MTTQRAKQLLKGLRIHHLGFGFFWAVTFAAISGFSGNEAQLGLWGAYSSVYQVTLPLCIGVLGIFYGLRRTEIPEWWSGVGCFMLSGALFLYYLVFQFQAGGQAECIAAGVLMGGASGIFFLMWELFYVTEGEQHAVVCIPLSAAMSVGIYLLLTLLPRTLSMFCTVIVLPLLCLLTLQKSLSEIQMYEPRRLNRTEIRRVAGDLWQPIVCVCALAFTWKLVTRLSTGGAEWYTWAALIGFVAASLLVVGLELFLSRGFNVMRIYQVLFPVLTVAFLLPLLFGEHYASPLVATSNFSFEVLNLLLIITCAVYTMRNELPSTPLYALCIGPTLLAMAIGSQTAALAGPATAGDIAQGTSILVVCLVLLAAVMAVVGSGKDRAPASLSEDEIMERPKRLRAGGSGLRRRKAKRDEQDVKSAAEHESETTEATTDDSEPDASVSDDRHPIGEHLKEHGLSAREVEVAELLMRGNRVSAIASRLYISENTVRGHAKNIYRKLGVHNRQELIDLGERLNQA